MGCRMLVAAGRIPLAQLLNDFKLMAQNKNEVHELNRENPEYKHSDGWGIVVGKSGRLNLYKKEVACWDDPKFNDFYYVDADFVLLHARKASVGSRLYSNTHPFEKQGWYFCHNGTIRDFKSKDKTDSEQFFTMVIEAMKKYPDPKDALLNTANQMKDYSAINCILANSKVAYILCKYVGYPAYYTMKYLKGKEYAIASSECLPSFKGDWKKIDNNNVVIINTVTQQVRVHP